MTDAGMLIVVGCAGSTPGPDSACSCYLVERDGHRLLLDVGTGASGPLQRYMKPTDVDAVFITHAHGDHCHDVTNLIYQWDQAGRTDDRLLVHGPPAVSEVLVGDWPRAKDRYDFAGVPTRIGPWRVRTATVRHSTENWAVRLDDELCYTGDTEPCPELDELAQGCAVILAEAAGFDAERPPSHLTAGDAGRLATTAGAGLLILTHVRAWHDPRAVLAEAARHAACPVVLAVPGLRTALADVRTTAAARS